MLFDFLRSAPCIPPAGPRHSPSSRLSPCSRTFAHIPHCLRVRRAFISSFAAAAAASVCLTLSTTCSGMRPPRSTPSHHMTPPVGLLIQGGCKGLLHRRPKPGQPGLQAVPRTAPIYPTRTLHPPQPSYMCLAWSCTYPDDAKTAADIFESPARARYFLSSAPSPPAALLQQYKQRVHEQCFL